MNRCLRCDTLFPDEIATCPACGYAPERREGIPLYAPELAGGNDSYGGDFFAHLAALEQGHFWFEARSRLILWLIARHFPLARRVMEIGCGTGFVLQGIRHLLPDAALYGSDLYVEGLRFAAQRVPSAVLLQMDALHIPYDSAFDLIGAFDVIEHIEDDAAALAQMYRALKPGGGLLISVPQHRALWSIVDEVSYHKRRYERGELLRRVEAAGFRVIRTTSFVSLLLPLMLLTRARKPADEAAFDLYAEFKLNPAVNAALSAVMAAETTAIQAGIGFRFGGSRLLAAVRPS
ncbi:MAG: methyltransferase domain-containing protein [Anaerolineae bacterium]|nr:methyltransferase domain-containing protein [Anaerolineae bacterium]NUQ05983.1 class I SAM-dependent methyltransferase [Anaerolineae bacterium]